MNEAQLIACIRSGSYPHAILIMGAEGSGRKTLARRAASFLLFGEMDEERLKRSAFCIDLLDPRGYDPGPGKSRVDQFRDKLRAICDIADARQTHVALLPDFHRCSEQMQNALLKTLEEPPRNSVFVLTGNPSGILSTVVSRSALLRIGERTPQELIGLLLERGVGPTDAQEAARRADGNIGAAIFYATPEGQDFARAADELLEQALFSGRTPLDGVARIPALEEDAPAAKEKRKRRIDAPTLRRLLDCWTQTVRRALFAAATGQIPEKSANLPEYAAAKRFTIGAIQGMMKVLTQAQKQLDATGNPAYLADRVVIELADCARADGRGKRAAAGKETTWQR